MAVASSDWTDAPVSFDGSRYSRSGLARTTASNVQKESLLTITVNGVPVMRLACSASMIEELVVGRLLTEGMIDSVDEVIGLAVVERNLRVDVRVRREASTKPDGAIPISPTYSSNLIQLENPSRSRMPLAPVEPIPWSVEHVFRLADVFAEDKTAHRVTRGSHSAYLAVGDKILFCREDIGRHNAFDKVVGAAAMSGVDLSKCTLYTSGRVPTDMAFKAVRAGLPILVSKSVATDKTIELAREYALTLICSATPTSLDVLNDPTAAPSGAISISA